MTDELPRVKTLHWKKKNNELNIHNLKELLDTLINILQDDIEEEINNNIIKDMKLLNWLNENFSNQLNLIANLKNSQEFTPQQLRERIIRDLRKITESA